MEVEANSVLIWKVQAAYQLDNHCQDAKKHGNGKSKLTGQPLCSVSVEYHG